MKFSGRRLECWGVLLSLAWVFTAQLALAQGVAVLSFEGDRKGRVRAQVESVLRRSGWVRVVPSEVYAEEASRQGLRGASASSLESVPVVAPALGLEGALTGQVGKKLRAFLLGPDGQELWRGEYEVTRGQLRRKELLRLAVDVGDVVRRARPPLPPPVAPASPAPGPESEVRLASRRQPATASLEAPVALPTPEEEELEPPEPSRLLEVDSEHPGSRGQAGRHPPVLRLFLGTAVPWRKYCARPGAVSCSEFDARAPSLRQGDTVDFYSRVPYAGGAVEMEFFPLARQQSLLRGLGLTASYQHAFARTTVRVRSPSGQTPAREVFATDQAFEAMLAWRYLFGLGQGAQPLWGHGGLRLGLLGRAFKGDEAVASPLPVTHRLFPAVGLDVAVPLLRTLRLVGSGQFFLRPRPGEGELLFGGSALAAEVRDHGESVSSFGWSVELGMAGELWGPVGYSARFRMTSFRDIFSGEGTRRGWLTGGVAEELYATALAGMSLSW